MKANILYNSKSNPDSCDEGEYVLVIEETDKCTDAHLCSSRAWAERDFIDMHMDSIIKNDITEIYSLGTLIWKKSE